MIKKIDDLKALSSIVFSHIKKNVITNTFLTSFEYQNEIVSHTLSYIEFDDSNNLYLIRERKNHIILNYYINDISFLKNELSIINNLFNDKIIVVEIPYKEELLADNVKSIFEECSYKFKINRIKMIKEFENSNYGGEIAFKNESESDIINRFLTNNFDEYTGCIPNIKTIEQRIKNNEIITIKEDNKIIGLLEFSNDAQYVLIKHLAIDENHRNKGLASSLINQLLKISSKSICTWTTLGSNAEKMYEKNGFYKSNYKSLVLIRGNLDE